MPSNGNFLSEAWVMSRWHGGVSNEGLAKAQVSQHGKALPGVDLHRELAEDLVLSLEGQSTFPNSRQACSSLLRSTSLPQ